MAIDTVATLRNVPLFEALDDDALAALAERMREVTFESGAEVVQEDRRGARVLAFFVIVEGSVVVARRGEEKASLGPGDYFGEIGLFLERPRTATVTASSDITCLALSGADFRAFLESEPTLAWPLLQTMARRLAELLD